MYLYNLLKIPLEKKNIEIAYYNMIKYDNVNISIIKRKQRKHRTKINDQML